MAIATDASARAGYWQIEQGTDPKLTTATKIAAFFGMAIAELWPKLAEKGTP